MKKQTLLTIAITVLVSGLTTVPAKAQLNKPYQLQAQEQVKAIPQSTALIIAFPQEVQLDAGQDKSHPMTVFLAQPIVDAMGRELVPANSPIAVKLVPSEGNIKIVAESIVVRGQVVPVEATSPIIPSTKKTLVSGNERARKNSPAWSRLGASFGGAIGKGSSNSMIKGGLTGNAVGIFKGMISSKKIRAVSIPQGSVHILQLKAPAALPTMSISNIPQTKVKQVPIKTKSKLPKSQ